MPYQCFVLVDGICSYLSIKLIAIWLGSFSVSLQDIHMRKPFKSSVIKDQQIVTAASRPSAISEVYEQCDAPPPLDMLNPYRFANTAQ